MNKVYKISATTLILVAALGISSCSTYQPSGYESDGVYYNPKTDKTYQQAQLQHGNEQGEQENKGEIKIGSPYFDAEGNGAEQFYYQDDVDSTNDNTQSKSATKVKINGYGLGGYNYFGNNDYTLTYNGSSNYNWGRNDGVEINIWNNYPWYSYGWGGFYNPYRWGYYNPYYGGYYGGYYGWNNWYGYPGYYGYYGWGYYNPYYGGYYGGYYGWNNWYGYPGYYGYYGWGWNRPYYGGYYGGYYGWNNWYGYPGYYGYGYGYNRPRGIYSQPGYRNGGRLNNTINSTRPVGSLNGRNNQISTGLRPTRDNTINNTTRPTREVRPTQTQQPTYNTRPTREAQQYQQPTRSYERTNSMNNSRPSYSTPSPSRGSSMSSGSMGGGSRGSSTGGGSRGGGRR
ncbi:hypothetical protein [Empedobacter sp. GD03739]|uniref:hypothetical protein n=1 Tax=Empedobacter sp. GD03739 TaxID=2975376 RepID=UPI00244C42AC|nr:hypothetical protein [Empedobacter sp. GD03739]MDH1601491.1 hypothetical protein [Empedobacter sp. GD03739]